tara:strand:+ start:433 stop:594 length:162 start_codon:yes stop_codon:yes gene_type:complete
LFISVADVVAGMHITSKSGFVQLADMGLLLVVVNIDGQRETDLSVASNFAQEP